MPNQNSRLKGLRDSAARFLAFLPALLVLACLDESDNRKGLSGPELSLAAAAAATGLDFPSNGQTSADVRFRFTGASLIPMYPATYVWRVNLRQQTGYYTTFYWGPGSQFTGDSYFGAHPYPDGEPKSSSRAHKWSLALNGYDMVSDAGGHSVQLGYDAWRTQALRVYDNGSKKVHEFYWDLPDTTKVIRVLLDRTYGSTPPPSPALNFGDAPWSVGNKRLSGILRGLQLYSAKLSMPDVLAEINSPLGTAAGAAGVWYLNVNPTPDDITDKSGKGHHPAWVSSARPALWTDMGSPPAPTVSLAANPGTVASGGTSTLTWSSTNATGCTAGGAWSGSKATSGSQQTQALTATSTFNLSCTGPGGTASQSVTVTVSNLPTVSLSANPTSVASGGRSTLTWSSTNATGCTAGGAWSGAKATSGSQQTQALTATSTFNLSCSGPGGTASQSVTVTVITNAPPTVSLSANPASINSGGTSTLTWSSTNATGCTAGGAWSGAKATSGSQQTQALTATSTFSLSCSGPGGTASQSATVTVNPPSGGTAGLNFPSNGQTSSDIRFRFTGANLIPMYPATYVWRVNLRRQSGYYTTFFWGPDGPFTGASYYGCHPYPDGGGHTTTTHKWEVSINGYDIVNDENGHSTQLGYDVWRTQALRAYDNGSKKVHEFYWDLPDTTKVIRVLLDRNYGSTPPNNPALTFGDAPWSVGNERLSGILRGMQLYSAKLSLPEVLSEVNAPLGTPAGQAGIWYLNVNPTPSDIADKSGKGHHPNWVGTGRPSLWNGP